ncbi:unnamed protein product [Caenorhabditis brenneri]
MIPFLLLLSLLVLARAEIPACNGPVIFNPPKDTTQNVWYPTNYTWIDAPLFPDDYKCEYQINAPKGWFVTIELTVNMNDTSSVNARVQVIDQLGRGEPVIKSLQEMFYFPQNGGKIQLATGKSRVQFGFKLKWEQYAAVSPMLNNVTVQDLRPLLWGYFDNRPVRVTADTRVSATIMPPPLDYYRQFLRGVVFFDGSTVNSKYLGTGTQLLASKNQWVSSGKYLTIMNLGYSYEGRIALQFQDYKNTKGIKKYQAIEFNPDDIEDVITLSLDPSNGPIALQSCCDPGAADVITYIGGTGKVDVYLGGVTKSKLNLMASYTGGNTGKTLPQAVFSQSRTYVISGGPVTMNITQNVSVFQLTETGRKGLLFTGNYGMVTNEDQSLFLELFAPHTDFTDASKMPDNDTIFRYTVEHADLLPNVTFSVRCNNQGNITELTYDSTHSVSLGTAIDMPGTSCVFTYTSNEIENLGIRMNFEILKAGSHYISEIFVFVFLIVCMFLKD